MMTPQYRATTTLQIEREAMNVVNMEDLIPSESPMDRDFYQTQYELLMSRSLARRVIAKARLDRASGLRERWRRHRRSSAPAPARRSAQRRREASDRACAASTVLASLQVEPVRNSRLVAVHFEFARSAAVRARGQCLRRSEFIASNLERRVQASSFATKYLSNRLAQIKRAAAGLREELRRLRRPGTDRLGGRRQAVAAGAEPRRAQCAAGVGAGRAHQGRGGVAPGQRTATAWPCRRSCPIR